MTYRMQKTMPKTVGLIECHWVPNIRGPGHVRTAAGQRSVIAQPVMVVDILSPQRQDHHRLCDKGLEEMINTRGSAMINETGRQTSGDVEQAISFPQQQGTAMGSHPDAVEFPDKLTLSEAFEYPLR